MPPSLLSGKGTPVAQPLPKRKLTVGERACYGQIVLSNRKPSNQFGGAPKGAERPSSGRSAGLPWALIRRHGVLRTFVEYGIARAILGGATLLPRTWALHFGYSVGAVAHRLLPHLRHHAETNLRLAFPEMAAAERDQIVREVFRTLGRLLAEVSQFPRLNPVNIDRVVRYEGLSHFLDAQATGRGVIFLTGHLGAWELSVYAHSVYGYPSSFLARRVDNPLVERLAERYRTMYGNRSIDKKTGLREVIRTLKAGGVVGILADLNALRPEGIFCDFFGVPAATTVGVATLALRTDAVVLPGYLVWEEAEQRHVLHFEPPIETVRTGDSDADVQVNTARYTALLESIIRRYPGQWLWIHRRWRTRPPGEPDLY
ncbi:MAG: lysophospholipid acyltransferase family protein [Blastocatellia bacterium]